MNTEFCYFCMQLPGFPVGGTPTLSLEEFDSRLDVVPDDDARYVVSCTFPLPPEAKYPRGSAAAQFQSFEESLRYEIACFRAAKAGQSIPPRPRHVTPNSAIQAQIESIAGLDPFKREKKLIEIRSIFLEKIAETKMLTREAAACYRFRLAMAWRENLYRNPAGRERFSETVDAIEDKFIDAPEVASKK